MTIWSFPTRILYGSGTSSETGAEVRTLDGTRALIVTDRGVVDAGVVENVRNTLTKSGVTFTVFDDISSNPHEKEAIEAARAFRESGADIVVAVGGGSVLDIGKLVRVCVRHDLPLAEFDDDKGGADKIVHPLPPMVAIPSTAGTGSEVGRSAVVTLEATGRKAVVFSPRLIPNVAILDPVLTLTLPAFLTAATGFDALTHSVEAYCAKGDHPMADAIALEAIRLIVENLATVVEKPQDEEARGAMLKASMMGAVAFQKGLGACHALAHPLSAAFDLHHGLANALCLPAVLDFNRSAVPIRVSRIARLLGVKADDVETLAFECAGAVRSLRRKVGLPSGLAEVGVEESSLGRLAGEAMEDSAHRLNPRPCTKDDMLALYQASL